MDFVTKAQDFLSKAYQGDIPTAKSMLHQDVALEMNGKNQLSGKHRSPDGFFNNFAKMMKLTAGSYKMTKPYEWINGKSSALLFAEEYAERNGITYYFDRIIKYDFDDDGLINYVRIFEGNPTITDEVFK